LLKKIEENFLCLIKQTKMDRPKFIH